MDSGGQFSMGALFHEDIPPCTSPQNKRKNNSAGLLQGGGDTCGVGGENNRHWNRVNEQMSKRKSATEWIYQMIGVKIPFATDRSFRGALYDGIVLCQVVNAVRPNTIQKIIEPTDLSHNSRGEQVRTQDNLSNFIQSVEWLGVPVHEIFSISDLEADGLEERPRVVSCILALKQLHASGRCERHEEGISNETASVNFHGMREKISTEYSSQSSSPINNNTFYPPAAGLPVASSIQTRSNSNYYSDQSSPTQRYSNNNSANNFGGGSNNNNNNNGSSNQYSLQLPGQLVNNGMVHNNKYNSNNNNQNYGLQPRNYSNQSSPNKNYNRNSGNNYYANNCNENVGYDENVNYNENNCNIYNDNGKNSHNIPARGQQINGNSNYGLQQNNKSYQQIGNQQQHNNQYNYNNNNINNNNNQNGNDYEYGATGQQQTSEALNRIMRNCSEITSGLGSRQPQPPPPYQQPPPPFQQQALPPYQVQPIQEAPFPQQQQQQQQKQQSQSIQQSSNILGNLLGNLNLNQVGTNLLGVGGGGGVQQQGQGQEQGDGENTQLSTISEALKPVVEQVVTGLIKEYEKRMMNMDADLKAMRERTNMWQSRCQEMQVELKETRALLDSRPAFPENSMTDQEKQEMERLRETEQALLDKLTEVEMENQQMEQELMDQRANTEELEYIANNYKNIQDENKQLYNLVQDLKGSIRVYCRVRPMGATGDDSPSCLEFGGERDVAIYSPANDSRKKFQFDQIFGPQSTQEQIYQETQGLIRCVLDGFNVCIFAYGQTGSGKTYTMSGPPGHDNKGIAFRALQDLFEINQARSQEYSYTFEVQMLEIYNEVVRDLLVDPEVSQSQRLELRSTERSGMNVPGAVKVPVGCTEDVFRIMELGGRCRATGETKMNERSSRSHCVLTVVVDGENLVTGDRSLACLHLVDLAGSERVARSEATGERLEEAKYINKSLSALGDVMSALASKKTHIPFRNSKLTQVLQDSLSGNAKALTIIHVAPEDSSYGESSTTLQFGARVTSITLGQVQKNTESGQLLEAKDTLKHQQKEIEQLRQILTDEQSKAADEKQKLQHEIQQLKVQLSCERDTVQPYNSRENVPSISNRETVGPLSTQRGMQRINSLQRNSTSGTSSALNNIAALNINKGQEKERGSLLSPRSRGNYTPRSRDALTATSAIPRLQQQTRKSGTLGKSASSQSLRHSASSLQQTLETGRKSGRGGRWK